MPGSSCRSQEMKTTNGREFIQVKVIAVLVRKDVAQMC